MKIVKHTARDMRQALRLVREQLGPDAVILSSKRTKNGVEVTAAIDFDAEQLEAQTAAPGDVRPYQPREFEPPPSEDTERSEPDPYTIADEQQTAFARVRAAVEAESVSRRAPAANRAEAPARVSERAETPRAPTPESAPLRAATAVREARQSSAARLIEARVDDR